MLPSVFLSVFVLNTSFGVAAPARLIFPVARYAASPSPANAAEPPRSSYEVLLTVPQYDLPGVVDHHEA